MRGTPFPLTLRSLADPAAMPTDASDRVKRLAFKLDVHTLKELALALGIETVQSTRPKLTKELLAMAICDVRTTCVRG